MSEMYNNPVNDYAADKAYKAEVHKEAARYKALDHELAALRQQIADLECAVVGLREGLKPFAERYDHQLDGADQVLCEMPNWEFRRANELLATPNPGERVQRVVEAAREETNAETEYLARPCKALFDWVEQKQLKRREAVRALDGRGESE